MSHNPLITVVTALYGTPGHPIVDVSEQIQTLFDNQFAANNNIQQFQLNNIEPTLFNIPDPAYGIVKTLVLSYSLPEVAPGRVFSRGAQDAGSLLLRVGPAHNITVLKAVYATPQGGLDVTDKLNTYFADPGNSTTLTIGSQLFWDALTNGADPAYGTRKSFGAVYSRLNNPTNINRVCGYDGQDVTFF